MWDLKVYCCIKGIVNTNHNIQILYLTMFFTARVSRTLNRSNESLSIADFRNMPSVQNNVYKHFFIKLGTLRTLTLSFKMLVESLYKMFYTKESQVKSNQSTKRETLVRHMNKCKSVI